MAYPVVVDADVLYSIETTDFFLTMATMGLFRPYWSAKILDEVRNNLAERLDLDMDKINHRLATMNVAIPDALRSVPDDVIDVMPINEKDRHVLALAVVTDVETIVTNNTKDFPKDQLDPYDVEAVNADDFALAQVDLHGHAVTAAIDAMAHRRKRPPKTREDIITRLSVELPKAMQALRNLLLPD